MKPRILLAAIRNLSLAVGLLSASLAACTAAPPDFPDWVIPVPEGTPIIEYPAVPLGERAERIDLVEDLVIGRETDDARSLFYRPSAIAVDSAGRVDHGDRFEVGVAKPKRTG